MTLAEKWMRQGRREGRKQGLEEGVAKGVAQGRLDGQRRLLENLLRLKFGEIDEATQAWLKTADEPALEAASERVLTAATLGEMIGPDVR